MQGGLMGAGRTPGDSGDCLRSLSLPGLRAKLTISLDALDALHGAMHTALLIFCSQVLHFGDLSQVPSLLIYVLLIPKFS